MMMKKLLLLAALSLAPSAAFAACTNPLPILNGSAASVNMSVSQNTADASCMYNVTPNQGGAPISLTNPWFIAPATAAIFPASQSGAWSITNISGSISLPTGASTSALQTTGNTSLGTIATNSATQATAANQAGPNTASTTNPTSTLTLPATTTAYTAGQLVANSATAGSVVNPSFAIANSAGGASIARLRLSTNDTTSTAWGAQTIQVDLWTATPTWTSGDRGTWLPATGAAGHLGSYTCVMGTVWGDGVASECYPAVGNSSLPKLASGTSIFWSLQAVTGSGVSGASKVFSLVAEVQN